MRGIITKLLIVVVAYVLFKEGFDDFRFNLEMANPKEFTVEELEKTPKEEIPRYLRVKDVMIFSDSYVESFNKKSGTLQAITYPIFSLSAVQSLGEDAKNIRVSLLIYDSSVTREQVEDGSYFENLGDVVEGKYSGDAVSSEIKNMFADGGYILNKNAIELRRGATPWGYAACIAAMLGALAAWLLIGYSFVPSKEKKVEEKAKTLA